MKFIGTPLYMFIFGILFLVSSSYAIFSRIESKETLPSNCQQLANRIESIYSDTNPSFREDGFNFIGEQKENTCILSSTDKENNRTYRDESLSDSSSTTLGFVKISYFNEQTLYSHKQDELFARYPEITNLFEQTDKNYKSLNECIQKSINSGIDINKLDVYFNNGACAISEQIK